MQKKPKEEKRQERPRRRLRDLKQSQSSRQMKFSMRFTPDLGVGDGQGVGMAARDIGSTVFDEGDVDELPKPIRQTRVVYPRRAKAAGIEGIVSLVLLIGRSGRVMDVTVESSPSPLFNRPVIRSVRQWKFRPAQKGGVAVQVRMRQNIAFELDK